jgi:hypothetical protein
MEAMEAMEEMEGMEEDGVAMAVMVVMEAAGKLQTARAWMVGNQNSKQGEGHGFLSYDSCLTLRYLAR